MTDPIAQPTGLPAAVNQPSIANDQIAAGHTPAAADRRPGTNDPFSSVDADLRILDGLSPAEQVPVLDRIHRALTATLATSDTGHGRTGPPSGPAASGGG